MRNALVAAAMIVAGTTSAIAAQTTVNSFSPAQEAHAKAAITQAGYRPEALAAVQDGNFFFTATKGGDVYQATVTQAGKVFVSTGLPATESNSSTG